MKTVNNEGKRVRAGDISAPAHNPRELIRLSEPHAQHINRHAAHEQQPAVHHLVPAVYPEWLGSQVFTSTYQCRFAYVVGEMARGIASVDMVVAAVNAGMVGFFGSAGLKPATIAEAIAEIQSRTDQEFSWGANLIFSPDDPELERVTVDLFLETGVRLVSASAFMKLTPDIVRYSASGLERRSDGTIARNTHVFAKISRTEIAAQFMAPPPKTMLEKLVADGAITAQQAEMQSKLPVAQNITVEGCSGGHTDNRPLTSLFPAIAMVRERLSQEHGFEETIRLGAAGGIGTPQATAAAFQMGADYILTGSINQSAVEAGLSEQARGMLAQCEIADVAMAPAADMFELGVEVQVLKRGTMFSVRGKKLYALYRTYDSLEALPEKERSWLEKQVLKESIETAWQKARTRIALKDPQRAQRADGDAKMRMAIVFKGYLFSGAQWARDGKVDRKADYQIWCGPSMGAFNDWVRDSFLEKPEARTVEQIGLNLLEGAAAITRAQQLRSMGFNVPVSAFHFKPRALALD